MLLVGGETYEKRVRSNIMFLPDVTKDYRGMEKNEFIRKILEITLQHYYCSIVTAPVHCVSQSFDTKHEYFFVVSSLFDCQL